MASDPLVTLEQQNGGGHRCISPPPAPIIGGRDLESRVAASIQARLDSVPPMHSECCIYRVPERLRKINEEAYTPLFVSIGPFHHGKENLKVQETLKWQHLHSFMGRNSEVHLSQYVKTIKEKEESIRKCYAEIISVNSDEFVTMMVVDGCFILEYILRSTVYPPSSTNPWFWDAIGRDLILLENQLPFFVLEDLYKLNIGNNLDDLTSIIRSSSFLFDSSMLPAKEEQVLQENRNWSRVRKLHAFVIEGCSCSHGLPSDNINEEADPAVLLPTGTSSLTVDIPAQTSEKMHLLDFVRDYFIPSSSAANTSSSRNKKLQLPHNVTALHKAGVKLEVGGAGKRLLDVSFENGVLAFPCIIIEDSAESLLRNMIAFEQLYCVGPKYITDYATLLDSLIDTSKDVELLHYHGIIKNSLGDHEEVSLLFNKLVKEVIVDETDRFCFYGLCQDLKCVSQVLACMDGRFEANLFQHTMDSNFSYCRSCAHCSYILTDNIHHQILY